MPLKHAVLIEPLSESDGGGYIATVPDLPGCMSDGDTAEEALRNVQDAIASWLEVEKAEKLRLLREEIAKGLADVEAGRVYEWDFEDFMRRARLGREDVDGRDKPGHDD